MRRSRSPDPDPRIEVVCEESTEQSLLQAWAAASRPQERERLATRLLSDRRRAIYCWCRKQESDPEVAEDLAQEVLLRALTAMRREDTSISHFGAWLFTLTRNHCANHRRQRSRRPRTIDSFDLDRIESERLSPQKQLEREEERALVRSWMRIHLSERERSALWMRIVDELPLDHIAELLGLNDRDEVRVLLQRAKRHLRAGARVEMSAETTSARDPEGEMQA